MSEKDYSFSVWYLQCFQSRSSVFGFATMVVCCLIGCSNVFVKGSKSLKYFQIFFRSGGTTAMVGRVRSPFCLTKCQSMFETFSCCNYFTSWFFTNYIKVTSCQEKAAVSVSSINRSRESYCYMVPTRTHFFTEEWLSSDVSSGQKSLRRKAS